MQVLLRRCSRGASLFHQLPRTTTQQIELGGANLGAPLAIALSQVARYAKGADGGEGGGSDGHIQKLLKQLEPKKPKEHGMSEEELQEADRRAKEYSRRKMEEHRQWQAATTAKIKLKRAALAALPPELRDAASQPDYEPIPPDRQLPTDTPPIIAYRKWKQRQQRQEQQRQRG